MRKLKDIFTRQYVKDTAQAFYDKNLATEEKRRVFGFNVGSTLASAAFGIGVMAAVKAATVAAVTTLAGASTAFTLGAVTAAGAPVAAVLTGLTVAAGLTSGLFRNISDRKALARAGQDVPKFWSRENGKAFFAKGNLLTMGLSAGASLLGGLFVVDFAPQTPSAGPTQAFNSMAEGPVHPITVAEAAPAIAPSTAVAGDALKADPLTSSPAPGVLSRMFERNPLGAFFGGTPAAVPDPLVASAITPTADFVNPPSAESVASASPAVAASVPNVSEATVDSTGPDAVKAPYVDPADAVAAALDKGTPPPVVPEVTVSAADVAPVKPTPVAPIIAPDAVVLPEASAENTPAIEPAAIDVVPAPKDAIIPATAADAPTVATLATDPASASAAPATVEPKAYEGQKVGECKLSEVLNVFNEGNYPPAKPLPNIFTADCTIYSETAQKGDYVALKGAAEYSTAFDAKATVHWNTLSSVASEIRDWILPHAEVKLENQMYNGMTQVKINPPSFTMSLNP